MAAASILGAPLEFEDITSRTGIAFHHDASKTSSKHLIEAMGAGVAMLDFDGDSRLDLYFVNGADIRAAEQSGEFVKSEPRFWNRLYRNLGGWRFEDVTEHAGVAGSGYGMGAAVADYDGDGDPDLFVTNFGPDLLFRNEGGGQFTEVAADAGIGADDWSAGAAFADFDRDGRLDLIVTKYVRWSLAESHPCGGVSADRPSYCHPREFAAVAHTLYRNLGSGQFRDVSREAGIAGLRGKGLGVALNDFDGDGWVDVAVANDSFPQQLFRNKAGLGFAEVAVSAGVAHDAEGRDYAGMGIAWEDFDNDLRPDVLVNALGRQGYWLYRNRGEWFEPVSDQTGITAVAGLRSGWGMGLIDFDNDGWRDLLVGQGHVMDTIADSDEALSHEEPLLLARNLFGIFYDVAGQAGPVFERRMAARGVAFGDLDADGRIDCVVSVNDGPALILRNVSEAGPRLTVELEGVGDNREAIGATVRIETDDGGRQVAFHSRAGSYLSASSASLHFGLGPGRQVRGIEVIWPNGQLQSLAMPQGPVTVVRQSEASADARR